MMKTSSREELRRNYRPHRIRVLFIGESPPAGGAFFYQANSNLWRYTQEAFSFVFGQAYESGEAFLDHFQQLGCYLDDLCLTPVNHLSKKERLQRRQAGVESLAKRLLEISPQVVISVMNSIRPHILQAMSKAGFEQVPVYSLPFPGLGNQRRYVSELVDVLRALQKKQILPEFNII